MAHRATIEFNGSEYWADISNDLREAAVNYAMSEGVDMQTALGEVLAGDIVSVEEK